MPICPECGTEFSLNSHNQRFCCPQCCQRSSNRKRWEREKARTRPAIRGQHAGTVQAWNPEEGRDPFDGIDRCTGLPMQNANYCPLG